MIILTALFLLGAGEPESTSVSASAPPFIIIAPDGSAAVPAGVRSLEGDELDVLHGRQGPVVIAASDQLLLATNSGNSVNANTVTTGALRIDANAFAGFNGIGNFVMNSGNNNNLQGAITINIVTTTPNP